MGEVFHNLEWEPLYGIDEQGSGQSILQDALFLPTPATANVRSVNYSVIYTTGSNNHSQGLPSTNKWFQILAIAWYIARRTCPINNTPKLGSCQLIMKLLHRDGDLFCFDLAPLCARWFVVIWFVIVRMAIVRRSCEWSCDWQSVSPLLPYMLPCCYILDVALNNLNECCYSDSYREHLCFSAKSLVKTSIYPGWQAG